MIQGRRGDGLLEGGASLVAMVTTVLGNHEYGLSKVRRSDIPDVFCIVANHNLILEAHHAAVVGIVHAALELVRGKRLSARAGTMVCTRDRLRCNDRGPV